MTTLNLKLTLPDQLAREVQAAGLLSPERLEKWLRDQLQTRKVDDLFEAMDRMAAVDEPTLMSPEELQTELATLRTERRTQRTNW